MCPVNKCFSKHALYLTVLFVYKHVLHLTVLFALLYSMRAAEVGGST